MSSEATAADTSIPVSSTATTTIPSKMTVSNSGTNDTSNVVQADAPYNHIKPLQIHDQCHVQWHGKNPSTSTIISGSSNSSKNNSDSNDRSLINLPAIVIERRIARARTKRRKDDNSNINNNNGSGMNETSGNSNNNNSGKRQRNSMNHTTSNRGDTTTGSTNIPSLDITATKKEMYDTLPADALEYYIHYVDHDRRLDEWVTFDRFQLHTLHRHNQPSAAATSALSTKAADSDDNRVTTLDIHIDHQNNDNIDNNSTDDGDGDNYSDSGTAATATGGATRLTRRRRGKEAKLSHDTGGGQLTASASFSYNSHSHLPTLSTAPSHHLLSSESDHGNSGSVFSFRGGNWHAGSHNADPASAAFEREHEETTKVKNIETIVMGSWLVAAWYYSPFPAEYSDVETLYVCEFCLSYMKKRKTLKKHRAECTCRQPPGKEIYRHEDISVYELDGKEHRAYCQKLCLLAKLFLDHKTLYYDVTPFYFYVVTKVDCHGAHIVGYFSKEKVSNEGYNLACILTFPQYQQAGYGKFIISLSYELTKREGKTGSPEKPLSDLGKVSYRSYWTHVLMHLFANCDPNKTDITMNDMSQQTGIKTEDIISTLQSLDMIKVWKGQHVVYVQQSIIDDYMKLNKKLRLCQSEYLKWEPPKLRPIKDAL